MKRQPYITPMSSCMTPAGSTASTMGQKIAWMRQSPRLRGRADEVVNPQTGQLWLFSDDMRRSRFRLQGLLRSYAHDLLQSVRCGGSRHVKTVIDGKERLWSWCISGSAWTRSPGIAGFPIPTSDRADRSFAVSCIPTATERRGSCDSPGREWSTCRSRCASHHRSRCTTRISGEPTATARCGSNDGVTVFFSDYLPRRIFVDAAAGRWL
jgi:hypothetical protein